MIHRTANTSSLSAQTRGNEHPNEGRCLNCGVRITYCGAPFTLEVTCQGCGTVNVYEDSKKPSYTKEIQLYD